MRTVCFAVGALAAVAKEYEDNVKLLSQTDATLQPFVANQQVCLAPLPALGINSDTPRHPPLPAGGMNSDTPRHPPLPAGGMNSDTLRHPPLPAGGISSDTPRHHFV